MKKLVVLLLAVAFATPGFAKIIGKSDTVATLPSCKTGGQYQNQMAYVTDATSAAVLGPGGGNVAVWVLCLNGTWTISAVGSVSDLAAYVPKTVAGQQSVAATGAGNDVTVTATDDVIITPGDALTVTATGAANITAGAASKLETSAGAVTIDSAGGTDEVTIDGTAVTGDISIAAPDDISIYTGASDNSAINLNFADQDNDYVTLDVNGMAVSTRHSAVSHSLYADAEADAGFSSLSVDADDAADANGVTIKSTAATATVTAEIDVNGTAGTIAIDAKGGTDELGIAENAVSVSSGIAFRIVGGTAPPAACAGGTAGTVYYDTDINKMCICNGTNYVLMNDDATAAGCS